MEQTKDVSVIIINYNSSKFTLPCINSIFEKTDRSITFEVIVVDNNSAEDDYKLLTETLPRRENIKLVRSRINTGFGGGNMFGAQHATGRHLLFLNNDTLLKTDCLAQHVAFHEANSKAGVTGAQNFDEHDKFVPSFDHNKGLRKLLLGRSFLEKYANRPKRKRPHTGATAVDFVNGAFMFFKAKVFGQAGGFDNNIFLYFEEMDICHRIKKAGFDTYLLPESEILHYQGASTGKSKVMDREGLISYLYVINKNYSYLKYLTVKYYLAFSYLFKPRKWETLPIVLKGIALSDSLKQRQKFTI